MNRRTLLLATCSSTVAAIAGCATAGDSGGSDGGSSAGSDAVSDPEATPHRSALEIVDHDLVTHHFRVSACGVGDEATGSGREVIEDLYVEGSLENGAAVPLSRADLRVQVFDADGAVLNEYDESVRGLEPGSARAFEIMVYEQPDAVDDYEIELEAVEW